MKEKTFNISKCLGAVFETKKSNKNKRNFVDGEIAYHKKYGVCIVMGTFGGNCNTVMFKPNVSSMPFQASKIDLQHIKYIYTRGDHSAGYVLQGINYYKKLLK